MKRYFSDLLTIVALASTLSVLMEDRVLAQQHYTLTTFDIPGLSNIDVFANKLNDAGQVTGYYCDHTNCASGVHSFLRNPDGSFVFFDAPGATATAAVAINNAGQISGTYTGVLPGESFTQSKGLLRQTDGSFSFFDVPGADPQTTSANAIDSSGRIASNYIAGGLNRGFVRSADGTSYTDVVVPGSAHTYVLGINDSGQLTGFYRINGLFDVNHGYLRHADSTFTFVDYPGASDTLPFGLNNAGTVVGSYRVSGVEEHGFVRDVAGILSPFDVPGATAIILIGINNLGVLSGDYADSQGVRHGFIATPGGCAGTSASPCYSATIQQPINTDGSSVFKANRGVVPVKFMLASNGASTCQLPPATISLIRASGGTAGPIDESEYLSPADSGSNFRIDGCQYIYNLVPSALGVGTYKVQISIGAGVAGSATFGLR